eukprot:2559543-Amphidinium_carterae.1
MFGGGASSGGMQVPSPHMLYLCTTLASCSIGVSMCCLAIVAAAHAWRILVSCMEALGCGQCHRAAGKSEGSIKKPPKDSESAINLSQNG